MIWNILHYGAHLGALVGALLLMKDDSDESMIVGGIVFILAVVIFLMDHV